MVATKLKNLLIDRVDLVDKGANPEAHIVLFKRDGSENVNFAESVRAEAVQTPERTASERSLLKAAWDLVAKHLGIHGNKEGSGEDMAQNEAMTLDDLLKGVADEVKDAVKAMFAKQEQELASLREQVATLSKKNNGEATDDAINKADLPEPVRKRLEDLEKRAAEAEAILKAEREARVKAEIRKRAEGYSAIGEVDKIAKVLYEAQEKVSPEFAQELEVLFKAAHERITKGALFKEFGFSGGTAVSDDPAAQFDALVQKVANEEKIGYAEAARKVAKSHPELVAAYDQSIPVGKF